MDSICASVYKVLRLFLKIEGKIHYFLLNLIKFWLCLEHWFDYHNLHLYRTHDKCSKAKSRISFLDPQEYNMDNNRDNSVSISWLEVDNWTRQWSTLWFDRYWLQSRSRSFANYVPSLQFWWSAYINLLWYVLMAGFPSNLIKCLNRLSLSKHV